ncbi:MULTISPECIES: AraC family transcriptional regulator [unclassified Bacillus (in: firmicutes)]|uniref:AraC family transcriptional regulator n=1 Tax=unclassified Bacillus (in: firmicutes) TaxID=185979 RepID=UPI001120142F|nr:MULTISPECIES: AraC family transcriptional regulator [unclassified Bacillus (in: firmicutes)]
MHEFNRWQSERRGILNQEIKVFHIKDQIVNEFEYHYHDFNKIIIFIKGNVTYMIEGKAYKLKPWDLLIIGHGQIHKPIIDPTEEYERFIIWFDPAMVSKHSRENSNLLMCFDLAARREINLIRITDKPLEKIKSIVQELIETEREAAFGDDILKSALLMQLLIIINRIFIHDEAAAHSQDILFDKNITEVLTYINQHLNEDLSIQVLASKCFLSKYHLMRKFKSYTGYTLHQYILQKRLYLAKSMLSKGESMTHISQSAGFNDYSTFVRAFKKEFGLSPREYLKASNYE